MSEAHLIPRIQSKFPWKRFILYISLLLILSGIAFWIAVDLGGKRRFEQAKAALAGVSGFASWEDYQSQQTRISDEENILKHPVFETEDLDQTLSDGAGAWLGYGNFVDPRNALRFSSQETENLEQAWQLASAHRNKSLTLYLELLEAFQRGQIDLNPQAYESRLYHVVKFENLSEFIAFHSLIDFREGEIERANQGLNALFIITRDMLAPRNFPDLLKLFEAHSTIKYATLIMGDQSSIGKIPAKSFTAWRHLISDQRALCRQACVFDSLNLATLAVTVPAKDLRERKYVPLGFYHGVYATVFEARVLQIERLEQGHGLITKSELVGASDLPNQSKWWPSSKQNERAQFFDLKGILESLVVDFSNYSIRLALLQFHHEKQRWPDKLDELRPDYMKEVPINIDTGLPYPYKLSSEALPRLGDSDYWGPRSPIDLDKSFHAES